jgi:hypothetical protein
MRVLRRGAALCGCALLAACQSMPPPAPPPPAPAPPPPPPAAPPPVVAPAPERPWDVADLTPGDWTYRKDGKDSLALFGIADQPPRLSLLCDGAAGRIYLLVTGVAAPAGAMTIRTSNGVLTWPASHDAAGGALTATRPASDPGLDAIAFSRGRIAVEVEGVPRLVVPVWAEVARVVEDCRD